MEHNNPLIVGVLKAYRSRLFPHFKSDSITTEGGPFWGLRQRGEVRGKDPKSGEFTHKDWRILVRARPGEASRFYFLRPA